MLKHVCLKQFKHQTVTYVIFKILKTSLHLHCTDHFHQNTIKMASCNTFLPRLPPRIKTGRVGPCIGRSPWTLCQINSLPGSCAEWSYNAERAGEGLHLWGKARWEGGTGHESWPYVQENLQVGEHCCITERITGTLSQQSTSWLHFRFY